MSYIYSVHTYNMLSASICKVLNNKPLLRQFYFTNTAQYAKKEAGNVSMLGGSLKKKKLNKLGAVMEKKILPVEGDPVRLMNYCCGANIYKSGEDPKLSLEGEYPEWLWKLDIMPPSSFGEIVPNNSKPYWRTIRRIAMKRNNKLAQLKCL